LLGLPFNVLIRF